jgi:hypothetical protein
MEHLISDNSDNEEKFLTRLLADSIPSRGQKLVRSPTIADFLQLLMIGLFTCSVGCGYLYGTLIYNDAL